MKIFSRQSFAHLSSHILSISLIVLFCYGTLQAEESRFSYTIYALGEDRSLCASILAAVGHKVTSAPDVNSITLANLSVYDQVWFLETQDVPDATGRANLINFIKSGGKIFFMGDSYRSYRAALAVWRDSLFNELGAGGIKQSEEINPSQEAFYTNPYHVTSYSPNRVHYIDHGSGRNGAFENIGKGTVIVGAGINAKGDAIAIAFEYHSLLQAPNSRAVVYLNSNNLENWDLLAENIARFLGPKNRVILAARNTMALPGNNGQIKIDLHNIKDVSGVQFKLKADPDFLRWLQFNSTDRTIDFKISCEEDSDGFLRVVIASEVGATITQGTGTIGELIYQASPFVVIGDSADILMSAEMILDEFGEIMLSEAANGKFYCGILKGDVVMDGRVNIFDLVRTIDIILDRQPAANDFESEAADYNSDGSVNIIDVVGMINEILGREPTSALLKAETKAKINLENINDNAVIPLNISSDQNLIALQANLRYDTEKAEFSEPALTARSTGMKYAWSDINGKITLLMYSIDGAIIQAGEGSVLNFPIANKQQIDEKNFFQIENLILVDASGLPVRLTEIGNSEIGQTALSKEFLLAQNFPNPFNSETEISYYLPIAEKINLGIYNLLGEKIISLVNQEQIAGHYSIIWNGKNSSGEFVPSGIYFYRLLYSNNNCYTKKLTMLK